MVITREADYAVRLMVDLASKPEGTVISARILAADVGVPYELARTILGNLAEAGILDSRRGRSGGFALARPAEEVVLSDVLAAAGEELQLNVCVADPAKCTRSKNCAVHPIWNQASQVLREFLSTQTLAHMVGRQGVPAQ